MSVRIPTYETDRRAWSAFRTGAGLALFGLIGWFVGQALVAMLLQGGQVATGSVDLLVLAATLILMVLSILAVHEAGHLLAGWLVGFRPLLLVVGPMQLERRGCGWRLGLNRSLSLWGGLSASAPVDLQNLRRRTAWTVAGGPLSSLGAGVGLLLLCSVAPLPAAGTDSAAGIVALGTVVLASGSLAIGVVTLVPGHTSGFRTDGGRLLRLLGGGREAEGEEALYALAGISMGGERPSEWPPELVERALRLAPEGPLGIAARQMAHLHALDRGKPGEATLHLESALAHRGALPGPLRPALLAQGAYFAAVHERDPARGRRLLDEVRGRGLALEHQLLLAEAAIHFAKGNRVESRELAARARSRLKMTLDRGMAEAEGEWLDQLEGGPEGAVSRGP